jgi:hypothetical protein
MYGIAGWKHTAGMPELSSMDQLPKLKGKLHVDKTDHLYGKPKYDKANQASARMHGVR